MTRILAVDIGNTSAFFAEMADSKVQKTDRVATCDALLSGTTLKIKRRFASSRLEAIVIASVVPAVGRSLKKRLQKILAIPAYLIGTDLRVPIINRYRDPKQVGIDRLVNAVAAYDRHRGPSVIIDFGTAITLDAISSTGEYLGGVIAPGIELSLEALFQKTALLPKIRLKHTGRKLIGRDTVESIRIGCTLGLGGLCDLLAFKMKRALGPKTLVTATGGYAAFMKRYCRSIDIIDPHLTVRGIHLVYSHLKIT